MADKVREHNEYLRHKAKYIGVGNADTTREEFFTNVHRDTLASIVLHDSLLTYNSVAMSKHKHLVRRDLIKRMVQPLQPKEDAQKK
ncbi:hypothetical protein CJJ07_001554 [Candidozyma auris]|nr:hypothetical protein CJJ07_001554 [[Candida] auris]QEL60809.1 hypothetical protein CJJ09_002928 [[Candida] auris]